jgi:nitrogen-specific signal transduction histidine kinase
VAAVVDAHRGTVTVASQPGHTQFAVRLPLAQFAPAAPAGPGPDLRATST